MSARSSQSRPGRLDDKVAIVTGSTRGIGRATAVRFAEEGAKVRMPASPFSARWLLQSNAGRAEKPGRPGDARLRLPEPRQARLVAAH